MTWIDRPGGYELFFNRDERRTRLPGRPPVEVACGDTRVVAPVDGDHGGTWLAVNEWGVAIALLNGAAVRAAHEPTGGYTSRGLLVTALADSRSAGEAERRIERADLTRFRPFVLVLLDGAGRRWVASWRSGSLSVDPDATPQLPIVSSSFDTDEVRRGRRDRFRELIAASGERDRRSIHLAYHADHAPVAGPRSVCMHRPDAETVSFSHVQVDDRVVRYAYAPRSPCLGLPDTEPVVLARRPARASEA